MSIPNERIKEAQALDLANEAHSLLKGDGDVEISGVSHSEKEFACGKVVTIKILNDDGAMLLGRDKGSYITIELPNIDEAAAAELLTTASEEIAGAVSSLLPPCNQDSQKPILLVGLGNFKTTADSIGPKVIAHIQPTRHFFNRQYADEIRPVAAISPGVVGNTGIETAALIRGVCREISPSAVIVVDALAAAKLSGVMHSIQICDTGIRPGSGVKNHRLAINEAYLGVPVIAIGIPTVVLAASIIRQSVETALQSPGVSVESTPNDVQTSVIEEMLGAQQASPVMTPKEADELVPLAALIIAAGLTRALHPGATADDFVDYMQGV